MRSNHESKGNPEKYYLFGLIEPNQYCNVGGKVSDRDTNGESVPEEGNEVCL